MDITVTIPDDREPEFRQWFTEWLGGIETYPTDQPITAAAAWWDQLTSREREIVSLWIDAAPNLVSGADIVTELGLDHQNEIRGVLSWTQRRGKKVGFDIVWKFTVDRSGDAPQGYYGIRSRAYADLLAQGRELSESRS